MNRAARCSLLVAGVVVATLGGCAIQPDSGPRDVPEDHPSRIAIGTPVEGAEAQGSGRIFLIAPEGSDARLRAVPRNPKGQEELIETLIQGQNGEELADGLSTEIPSDLGVNSVRFEGGVVVVDVTDEIEELGDTTLQLAVSQIVFTASELPGAESVLIRVDGANRSWPDGDGDLQSDPLTVYDFTGWSESAQPPYPVTPRTPATAAATTTTTPTPTTTTAPPVTATG